MPRPKRRKIEAYRLIISGLRIGLGYADVLRRARASLDDEREAVQRLGDKSCVLHNMEPIDLGLWLVFYSYTEGDRPDVIDTSTLTIHANPLADDETQIEWTHALYSSSLDRNLMLIERVQRGMWPSRVESYLQWLLDHPRNESLRREVQANAQEPLTVTLELEVAGSFMEQVDAMSRIASASLRIARPNPGWQDYENLLSEEARASDAKYAEIEMHARRNASLRRDDGIVEAMRAMDQNNTLGHAAVEGVLDGQTQRISTEKHGRAMVKYLPTDEDGNVQHDAAREKFFEMLGEME
jgi:hypothetical protein